MTDLGRTPVIVGLVLAAVGAVLWLGAGKGWTGRLPGDIHWTRGNFSFHFPIVTGVIISIVMTILLWFFRK